MWFYGSSCLLPMTRMTLSNPHVRFHTLFDCQYWHIRKLLQDWSSCNLAEWQYVIELVASWHELGFTVLLVLLCVNNKLLLVVVLYVLCISMDVESFLFGRIAFLVIYLEPRGPLRLGPSKICFCNFGPWDLLLCPNKLYLHEQRIPTLGKWVHVSVIMLVQV